MKKGMSEIMFDDGTIEESIQAAAKIGYDGIEARSAKEHAHGVDLDTDADQRSEIKQKAADAGIAICCVSASIRYADPATNPEARDDTLRYIDLAGDLGVPIIRVFGGPISQEQPPAVPEPGTAALMLLGLAGLARVGRSRTPR